MDDPVQAKTYLTKIYSSAERMSNLINEVLQYSRLSGKLDYNSVDLNTLIRDITSEAEAHSSDKKPIFTLSVLPELEGSAAQLRQLFSNLISNSIKYCRATPEINISATTVTENGIEKAQIFVKDNGIGFDEKYKTEIFDLFKRLHGRFEYEGTGIGLSICKKIAERHGGEIAAESKPGEGALFLITLPLKQADRM